MTEISGMFTELLTEALGGLRDGIDESVVRGLSEFVEFADGIGVGFEDHEIQNMIFDILSGTLCDAIGSIERQDPESEDALAGVRRMLALAKRFNFNVEPYEERIPV
jgi:hypothetical protein